MRQSGSSIVEVVVMMVIISVSIVGIYSMVNNAQKLAKTTDDRLIAVNLAKEWLESVGALRDTFVLRSYEAIDCFFTIDISNMNNSKCYQNGITQKSARYLLLDNKTLALNTGSNPAPVCINSAGWFSQEFSKAGTSCNTSPLCGKTQKECQTQFTRNIIFEPCTEPMSECVKVRVDITWWKAVENPAGDESLSLSQVFTRH